MESLLTLMNLTPMEGFIDSIASIGNVILYPFYWLISGFIVFVHMIVGFVFGPGTGVTWVLTIVLLTALIRSAMLPLYFKQMRSQRGMTALQPELQKLREKYKGDPQRLNAETMKLQQENGVSMFASCLPALAQMPVFMGLFWVINSVSRAQADAAGNFPTVKGWWLQQRPQLVESMQDAHVFGAKFADTYTMAGGGQMTLPQNATQILAIVLGVSMMAVLFIQQLYMMKRNMQPSMLEGPMGQQQKMMLFMFPLMYLFSMFAVPIAVLMYWLTSNLWTFGQMYIGVRRYPTPGTLAFADWEDRMIRQGKDPVAIEAERIAAARAKAKKKGPSRMQQAMQAQLEAQEAAKKAVAEAEVKMNETSDTVVRVDPETGKKVVVRKQPKNSSRAKRKHK
jgi:YidC/Oxa1 family membrane protein insertase